MNNNILSTLIEFAAAHALILVLGGLCLVGLIRLTVAEMRSPYRSRRSASGNDQ